LTGQSLHALSGVALGEGEVTADGTWAPQRFGRAAASGGVIAVKLPAASAMLLSIAPASG
jgi:hypothetical protein